MVQHITPIIDYRKIADALQYYSRCGFREVAVPWILQKEAYYATRQFGGLCNRDFETLGGYLNASGEQGFIELMLSGVKLERSMCVTSCFRDEQYDAIHHTYFVKVELIDMNAEVQNLMSMIESCKLFFDFYLSSQVRTRIERTQDAEYSFDILTQGSDIELGSYGIREYRNFHWIYGTGLAMPRLDYALLAV